MTESAGGAIPVAMPKKKKKMFYTGSDGVLRNLVNYYIYSHCMMQPWSVNRNICSWILIVWCQERCYTRICTQYNCCWSVSYLVKSLYNCFNICLTMSYKIFIFRSKWIGDPRKIVLRPHLGSWPTGWEPLG